MMRDLGLSEAFRPAAGALWALLLLLITAGPVPSSEGREEIVAYGVGSWDPESGLGNHRVVVRVEAPEAPAPAKPDKASRKLTKAIGPALPPAARVRIDWRRRDFEPEKKNVVVVDATTGERVLKVLPVRMDREEAEFLFEPRTVPGDYYFYYLPYKSEGRKNYPSVKYDPPEWSTDPGLTTGQPVSTRATSLRPPGPRKASSKLKSSPSSPPMPSAPSRRWRGSRPRPSARSFSTRIPARLTSSSPKTVRSRSA